MIFIDNKYTRWYFRIIDHARSNPPKGYTEWHHIVPRSLGGGDESENLIQLSARQHLICHILLPKMTCGEDRKKMIYAARMMTICDRDGNRSVRVNSRIYESIKVEWIDQVRKANRSRPVSQETREKLRDLNLGRRYGPPSKETRNKISQALSGIKRSDETRAKVSASLMGNRRNPWTEESRKKVSDSLTGRKLSTEHRAAASNGLKEKWKDSDYRERMSNAAKNRPKVHCEHCEKEFTPQMYARWHGDRCSSKKEGVD